MLNRLSQFINLHIKNIKTCIQYEITEIIQNRTQQRKEAYYFEL